MRKLKTRNRGNNTRLDMANVKCGPGTIITAFFMGPLIEFFNVQVARPFLNGKSGKQK